MIKRLIKLIPKLLDEFEPLIIVFAHVKFTPDAFSIIIPLAPASVILYCPGHNVTFVFTYKSSYGGSTLALVSSQSLTPQPDSDALNPSPSVSSHSVTTKASNFLHHIFQQTESSSLTE